MVKSIKKVFSSFVVMATAMSSFVGTLGFAQNASAAMAGDLIKASGPAVYYYAADGKRYVFPNEKTYFSWYVDFSGVKTISDSELASITIGGNVTVRPGTKLVKITTDPKVYAVTKCGVLHWIESETVAKSLYGDAWGTRVIDVPDAFFVNYSVGSSLATAVHPDGQLVSYAGDSSQYVVWNGQKRKFASDAAFMANNLNKINSVMTTISYPNGADVTGYEADLGATVCAGSSTPVGGTVTVSLASDTPAGMTVPRNSSSVPLAKYMFVGTGTIKGLTIHRVGVGAASDLANIYVYDANGTRLTTGRTINSTTHTATFSGLNVNVTGAGTALHLYGDFNVASGSTGGQHSFEIMDAGSVVIDAGTVQGSFPVRGNVYTVGTSAAGRLDVTKGATPSNPTVGSTDVEISNFKLTANTNNILVKQVTLYQAGSITNSDLSNFKLYQGNTMVAEAASVTGDGRIVLKFNPAYEIQNGTTKVFSLRAKVGGRSDRTIKTYIEYTTDVMALDKVFNAGPAVCISDTANEGGCPSSGSFGSFNGSGTNYIEVTTQGGNLTRAFNGPATSNVAKGSLGVVLHKFALTSENDVEIRNLRFSIDKTSGSGCYVKGSAGTAYFRNIRIVNQDSNQNWMGPTEIPSSVGSSQTGSGTLVLSDTQNMTAGQTVNLAVVADLSNTEDASNEFYGGTCGYKATVYAMQSNDVRLTDTGEYLATSKIVPNNNLVGNEMFVKASSLTISLASDPGTGTVVKKQQKVPVVGLVFAPGSQSSVLVTSVTLTCQADLATDGVNFGGDGAALATGLCDERISSLSLWDGNTQVGLAKAPDSTTGRAQINNMNLLLPAGSGGKTLVVKADLTSTASTTSPYDKVAVGIASTGDVVAQDADSNTITPSFGTGVATNATGSANPSVAQTILNSGTLTVASDAHPASTIVVAGKDAWVPFAQYKATAQYEAIMIDRMAIMASGTDADNADFAMVAVASGGAVKGSDILSAGASGTKDIDLSTNTITVPKNGSVQFQLWAKLSAIQASSSVSGATSGVHRSGHVPAMGLASGLTSGEWTSSYTGNNLNIRATGEASGERVYASSTNASHGNGMVSRKSKPVVTRLALSNGVLASGIVQDLYKFQIAADSAGSVSVKQIIFSLAKTSGVTLSSFQVYKGGSAMNPADYAVNFASSTGDDITDVESGSILAAHTSGWLIVSFTNEESISGSGNQYTLRASTSVSGSSQTVTINFFRDTSNPIVTGYIVNSTALGLFPSSAAVYHIDTAASVDGTANATGTFLWSDQSEVPHSSAVGGSGGSRDWTNDVYVDSLNEAQTISN